MANTERRSIRIGKELWDRFGQRTRDEGTTRSDMIINWITDYVNEDKTVTSELASIMTRIKAVRTRLVPTDGDIPE